MGTLQDELCLVQEVLTGGGMQIENFSQDNQLSNDRFIGLQKSVGKLKGKEKTIRENDELSKYHG